MKLFRIKYASLAAVLCLLGCDDISSISTPQLEVSPADVLFPKPDPGANTRRMTVELKNVGKGLLKIARIQLQEDDDTAELSILDGDDWQNVRDIEPEQSAFVTIGWRAVDAAADSGRLTITHIFHLNF